MNGAFGSCLTCKEILQAMAEYEGQNCGKPQLGFLEIWYRVAKSR